MQQMFDLLKEALFNIEAEISEIDIDAVFEEATYQEVAPLIYSVLKKKNLISKEKEKELLKKLRPRLAKCNGVFLTHVEISSLFKGIEHTIIKGVASAKYYPEPFLRIMGDTDVIVKDTEKAKEILENNGYELVRESDELWHIEYRKNYMTVELHHTIHGIPQGNIEVENLFSDMYEQTETYQTVFGDVTVPSHFHNGLIMLLHMHAHFNSSGFGLRHLCDWAVFVNSFTEEDFVKTFKEKLKAVGLWRFACLLSQTSGYIGLEQKEWMGKDETIAQMLLEDIISCGNFGKKDFNRINSQKYVPVVGNPKKKKSQMGQYFDYGVKTTMQIWPFYKKHKWLLPIGFIAYCVRTGYRLITKKAKIYDLTENDKIYDLYSQLKLFEK